MSERYEYNEGRNRPKNNGGKYSQLWLSILVSNNGKIIISAAECGEPTMQTAKYMDFARKIIAFSREKKLEQGQHDVSSDFREFPMPNGDEWAFIKVGY